MKILFPIGTLFPSEKGGPSNTVYWIAKGLHSMNIDVLCIATNYGINKNRLEFDKWLQSDFGNVLYTSDRIHTFPLKLLIRTIAKLKETDIIHLTSIFYPPSWILAPLAILLNRKIIWSVRGNFENEAMKISRWKKLPILWMVKILSSSKNIIFHSTSYSETINIRKFLGNKVKIIEIPNYMDMPDIVERDTKIEPYFLYVGRIHPIKALDRLIEALSSSTLFKQSDYTLKIVGEGEKNFINYLKKIAQDSGIGNRIQFLGHITGVEKQKLFSNAKFTFLVSHSENFGNVVVESLAQGTPVVASQGTPWAILDKTLSGFWVNNCIVDLGKVIDKILNMDEKTYTIYRANASKLCSENFDIKSGIYDWINLYSSFK